MRTQFLQKPQKIRLIAMSLKLGLDPIGVPWLKHNLRLYQAYPSLPAILFITQHNSNALSWALYKFRSGQLSFNSICATSYEYCYRMLSINGVKRINIHSFFLSFFVYFFRRQTNVGSAEFWSSLHWLQPLRNLMLFIFPEADQRLIC